MREGMREDGTTQAYNGYNNTRAEADRQRERKEEAPTQRHAQHARIQECRQLDVKTRNRISWNIWSGWHLHQTPS